MGMKKDDFPVKDEPGFDFNANLLTSYVEVLLGSLQRIEQTKPDINIDASTGRSLSNPSLLLGFIFKYLIGCEDEDEAIRYYKKNRKEMNSVFAVEKIAKKITFSDDDAEEPLVLPLSTKIHFVLYLFYHKDYDNEYMIKKFLSKRMSPRRNKRSSDRTAPEDEG
jgi:hypothetical protein